MLVSATLKSATVSTSQMRPNDLPSVFFYEDYYDVFIGDDFTFLSSVVRIENAEFIQWFTTDGGGVFNSETILYPAYTFGIIDY